MLAAFLVTAIQSSASAEWKKLQVINYTGFEIKRLYISSSGNGIWGDDLLGNKTLKNGGSVTINYDDKFRYFDLKIVFTNDDTPREWTGDRRRDFKDAWRMTIYNSGDTEENGKIIFSAAMN